MSEIKEASVCFWFYALPEKSTHSCMTVSFKDTTIIEVLLKMIVVYIKHLKYFCCTTAEAVCRATVAFK